MQIFHNLEEWLIFRRTLPEHLSLGFVPTMGNLHIGHLSLVEHSQKDNDKTAVSIFINPTQFNQKEDFIHYPRTLEADLAYLHKQGVNYCLLPSEEAIFNDSNRFQIQENSLCHLMEGKSRPRHFAGVLTVVMKLFQIAKPKRVYFGEKDYQQYLLIRDMIQAFFLDIQIKACPTIRETSGLAYSSRNNRLNAQERIKAEQFAQLFHQKKTCEAIAQELEKNQIDVEYIEEYANRRFIAVKVGNVRLIDNYDLTC